MDAAPGLRFPSNGFAPRCTLAQVFIDPKLSTCFTSHPPPPPFYGGTMRERFPSDYRAELRARGFSRRDLGRWAALMTAGAALPFYNEAALAQDLRAIGAIP